MGAVLESWLSEGFSKSSWVTMTDLLPAAEQISMSREVLPCPEAMAWEMAGARELSTIAKQASHATKRRFFLKNVMAE